MPFGLDPMDAVNAREQPEQLTVASERASEWLDRASAAALLVGGKLLPLVKPALALVALALVVTHVRRAS